MESMHQNQQSTQQTEFVDPMHAALPGFILSQTTEANFDLKSLPNQCNLSVQLDRSPYSKFVDGGGGKEKPLVGGWLIVG